MPFGFVLEKKALQVIMFFFIFCDPKLSGSN